MKQFSKLCKGRWLKKIILCKNSKNRFDNIHVYAYQYLKNIVTRVKEHSTSPSAIKEHLSSCTTCKDNYSCNSFKVIDSANSDFEVSIKEALYIKHKNPNLNKQLSTEGMSFMLKIFT